MTRIADGDDDDDDASDGNDDDDDDNVRHGGQHASVISRGSAARLLQYIAALSSTSTTIYCPGRARVVFECHSILW